MTRKTVKTALPTKHPVGPTLEQQIQAAHYKIACLEKQVYEIQADVHTLETRVGALELQITELTNSFYDLRTTVLKHLYPDQIPPPGPATDVKALESLSYQPPTGTLFPL